jgi:hypothetical protein
MPPPATKPNRGRLPGQLQKGKKQKKTVEMEDIEPEIHVR